MPKFAPLDYLNLLFIPLMVLTAFQAIKSWNCLTDDDLTSRDRYILKRVVFFLLVPPVVFCHELGHALAIKMLGGQVRDFHYAFLWGYVVPAGRFTQDGIVWTYFAGNLVQILIGLVALVAALFVRSPPGFALLVYFGLWTIGGTVIIYTLLSLTGLYGDWIAIYTSPAHGTVFAILVVHALLIGLMVWLIYSDHARAVFERRTRPAWAQQEKSLKAIAESQPSLQNWMNLAWTYYTAGLHRKAARCLSFATQCEAGNPETLILASSLDFRRGKVRQATETVHNLLRSTNITYEQRCRALITLAACEVKHGHLEEAIKTYDMAIMVNPQIGDHHLYKALLLGDLGRYEEAMAELSFCENLNWNDAGLKDVAAAQLKALQAKQSRPQ